MFRGEMCCLQLPLQCSGRKGSSYTKEKCSCMYIYRYIHRICAYIEVFMYDIYTHKYDICVYTYFTCTNMCVCVYLPTYRERCDTSEQLVNLVNVLFVKVFNRLGFFPKGNKKMNSKWRRSFHGSDLSTNGRVSGFPVLGTWHHGLPTLGA